MPDVRMPDGTIIKNVPPGTTRAQLTARLEKARQGDGGVMGFLNRTVSAGNELLIGGLEGAYNAASAITDPIIEKAANLVSSGSGTRALEGANRDRRAVVDKAEDAFVSNPNPIARTTGRIAGSIAIPVPKIAAAGKLGRVANRAVQGAVGGAGVREVDESAVAPAATGAIANVVLPPVLSRVAQSRPVQAVVQPVAKVVGNALDDVANKTGNYIAALKGKPAPTPLARPAAPAAPTVADAFGKEAAARQARFQSLGVNNPTTGMVTRDPAAYSFEVNQSKVLGSAEDLTMQMREVESALVERGRKLSRDMGGSKGAEATGKEVEGFLDAKRTELQRLTTKLYDQARETRGDEIVGRLDGFRARMTDPDVVDNAAFDAMREGLVRRMTRLGLIGKNGSLSQPINVRQAEELRKFIGTLGNATEPGIRYMRGQLITALDDDVVATIGDDAFKAARESAKAGFAEFKKTFAGKLADEGIAPERLTSRILGDGVRLDDVRAIKQSMFSGTPEQVARGKQAWRGLGGQAVDDLLARAVDADGNLKGTVLYREFSKMSPKLRLLLEPKDYKVLENLAAATRDVKALPSGNSVNTSNTATTMANLFDSAPQSLRAGWTGLLKRLASVGAHAGTAFVAPGVGNVALAGVQGGAAAVASTKAQMAAAEALARRIKIARSPEEAAAAVREAQKLAESGPAIREFFNQSGIGRIIGGTAAAPQ